MPAFAFKYCEWCKEHIEDDIETHTSRCMYEVAACPNDCGEILQRYVLPDHIEYECPNTSRECEFCSEIVLQSDLRAHEEICRYETTESDKTTTASVSASSVQENIDTFSGQTSEGCYYCGKKLNNDKLQMHIQNCDFNLQNCDKCDAKVQKWCMVSHLKEQCDKRIIQCDYCHENIVADSLEYHLGDCDFVPLLCENQCGRETPRRHLRLHLTEECPKRLVGCEHCGEELEAALLKEHYVECEKYPVLCPYDCGVSCTRSHIEKHLDKGCMKLHAPCRYDKILCNYQGYPGDLRDHEQNDCVHHVELMRVCIENLLSTVEEQRSVINELKQVVENLKNTSTPYRYLWKVTNFTNKLQTFNRGDFIDSPTFYINEYSYRMKIRLYPNGDKTPQGYVALYVCIVSGEYDSLLPWPFKGTVTYKLLAQAQGEPDVTGSFQGCDNNDSFQRPKKDEKNKGYGMRKFVSRQKLENGSYIYDDTIFIEVTVTLER